MDIIHPLLYREIRKKKKYFNLWVLLQCFYWACIFQTYKVSWKHYRNEVTSVERWEKIMFLTTLRSFLRILSCGFTIDNRRVSKQKKTYTIFATLMSFRCFARENSKKKNRKNKQRYLKSVFFCKIVNLICLDLL